MGTGGAAGKAKCIAAPAGRRAARRWPCGAGGGAPWCGMTDPTRTPPAADPVPAGPAPSATPKRELPPAAERALAEADERRAALEEAAKLPPERHGRGGLEPVRYGDWEIKGLAVDF